MNLTQYEREVMERFDKAFPLEMREVYKQGDGSWSAGVVKMNKVTKDFLLSALQGQRKVIEETIKKIPCKWEEDEYDYLMDEVTKLLSESNNK